MTEPIQRSRDGHNREVPRRLAEVFAGRQPLERLCGRIDEIRAELGSLREEPFCRDIDVSSVQRLLETARVKLVQGMPFAKCDCPNRELDCPKCGGDRWVSVVACARVGETLPGPQFSKEL